ncbi:MAG: O-antigen ligase family protein [Candidatus Riflebacteria bacterium]|nr:O-antigen ligase family protein [Candidatus Riflebacteria bacterium]
MILARWFDLFSPFLGKALSVLLVFSVWIFSFDHDNPFYYQEFLTVLLATLSLTFLLLLYPFKKPVRPFFPFGFFLIVGVISVAFAVLNSSFIESVKSGFLIFSQLILFVVFRLTLKKESFSTTIKAIILCGTLMALYSIFQSLGLDPIKWPDSPFKTVGTFGNPNFLSIYLVSTILLSYAAIESPEKVFFPDSFLFSSISLQISALLLAGSIGGFLCLLIGFGLIKTDFWLKFPFRITYLKKIGPALVIFLAILFCYLISTYCVAKYPWETLDKPPFGYFFIVSRLVEWKMGMDWITSSPFFGFGPDSSKYLFSAFRPRLGTMLSLSMYNDDPHAFPLKLIAETGFLSLFAFCGFLTLAFSLAVKKKRSYNFSLPEPFLKAILVTGFVIFCNSCFNNSLSIAPITNFFVLLASLHFGNCLEEIKWTNSTSLLRFGHLLSACFFSIFGISIFLESGKISESIWIGNGQLKHGGSQQSEITFKNVLKLDPRNLKAIWGVAKSYENCGKLNDEMEWLFLLNSISTNLFGCQYDIARVLFEQGAIIEAHKWAADFFRHNGSSVAHEILGRILLAEGRTREAEELFEQGILLQATWIPEERSAISRIKLLLASIAMDQKEFNKSEQYLTTIEKPVSDSHEYLFLKGLLSYNLSRTASALEFFENAWKAMPENPRYANSYGYLLLETNGDLEKAGEILLAGYNRIRQTKNIRLDDLLSITHSLATYYYKKGDLNKSRELLTSALRECPIDLNEKRQKFEKDLDKIIMEINSQKKIKK